MYNSGFFFHIFQMFLCAFNEATLKLLRVKKHKKYQIYNLIVAVTCDSGILFHINLRYYDSLGILLSIFFWFVLVCVSCGCVNIGLFLYH